jgi:hypothetical protein
MTAIMLCRRRLVTLVVGGDGSGTRTPGGRPQAWEGCALDQPLPTLPELLFTASSGRLLCVHNRVAVAR